MTLLSESDVLALRQDAVLCAESLLEAEAPFLQMVRRLAAIRVQLRELEQDEDLLLFTSIEAELDHIPVESARPYCAPDWLRQCDSEIAQAEALYESRVCAACRGIIARFRTAG